MINKNIFISQGWECPKCRRVYSPTTSMCGHCPSAQSITTTTGTTTTFLCLNFKPDTVNTSSTKCMQCGREKYQHQQISYL